MRPSPAAVASVRAEIDAARTVVIVTHRNPDCDTVGSAVAFARALRAQGKRVWVSLDNPPLDPTLAFVAGEEVFGPVPAPGAADLVITVDTASRSQLGSQRAQVDEARRCIKVDHHEGGDDFGDVRVVLPRIPACGLLVMRLLQALRIPITPDIAHPLYAALFADTGGFRHSNTGADAFRAAAELADAGADPGAVAQNFNAKSRARMQLEALGVTAMRTSPQGDVVWTTVTQEMLRKTGARMIEAEGLIDVIRSLNRTRIAVLFYEVGPRETRISVRSGADADARAVCLAFGGGGHTRAAGATLALPVADARRLVLAEVRRQLGPQRPGLEEREVG